MHPYVVIGAGPMGLCTVKQLKEQNIPVLGLEAHADVGGLWDIDSPTSTMYQSAHLISSKRMTEYADFPMRDEVATYPKHDELRQYFRDYAKHFGLYDHYRFGCWVSHAEPNAEGWLVTYRQGEAEHSLQASGLVLANGTLHEPKLANFAGEFDGERFHSSQYKSANVFDNKRVLIVGCGNSACDIAVDAVHRARSVDMVVRRGYYFLPKFVKGVPTDTLGGKIRLPNRLKQMVDGLLVKLISGKPSQYGLPDPDYRMYESHPVINSLFLHHIGHGDIKVRPAIDQLDGQGVRFSDGQRGEYDLVLEATGYKLHYPFIAREHLNWEGDAPSLYLNMFTPKHNNLFVMGMVEAAGLGWQGRDEQAQLLAKVIRTQLDNPAKAAKFEAKVAQHCNQRIDGGMQYLPLERMAYYVHKADYLAAIKQDMKALQAG